MAMAEIGAALEAAVELLGLSTLLPRGRELLGLKLRVVKASSASFADDTLVIEKTL